jgi:hypothetical protein
MYTYAYTCTYIGTFENDAVVTTKPDSSKANPVGEAVVVDVRIYVYSYICEHIHIYTYPLNLIL